MELLKQILELDRIAAEGRPRREHTMVEVVEDIRREQIRRYNQDEQKRRWKNERKTERRRGKL